MTAIWWIRRDLRLTDNAALQAALDRDLRSRGSYLVFHTGSPLDVLQKVRRETASETILAEEDFTPYALKRDDEVARKLPLHLIHGQTVFHPREVLKAGRAPYTVFTPYSKTWKARLARTLKIQPAPERIDTPTGTKTEPLHSFKVSPLFPAGEEEAQVRLEEFLHSRIYQYGENRNRMDLDSTSSLSPYLHFGMLEMRQAVHARSRPSVRRRAQVQSCG